MQLGGDDGDDHELRDAVAGDEPERGPAVVGEDDLDFAPVAGVDDAGGVGDGDAVCAGEPGAGGDEADVAFGDGDGDADDYL